MDDISCVTPDLMRTTKLLPMNQPEIGKLIRALRWETGLTQEQFAARLGVVYPTVNRWENGHVQPSPLAIQKIEDLLQEIGDRGQDLLERHSTN